MKDQDCDQSELQIRERRRMVILGLLQEVPDALAEPTAAIQVIIDYLTCMDGDLSPEFESASDQLTTITREKVGREAEILGQSWRRRSGSSKANAAYQGLRAIIEQHRH